MTLCSQTSSEDGKMNKCLWDNTKGKFTVCPKCNSPDQVVDMNAKHIHHWSRETIRTVKCKQYEIVISWEEYVRTGGKYS